ncbi:MAG: hypothetical protein KQH79_08190 [Bacteroidetes bacterium]|nr:hypothetical protein [Bacteroidota bacterium]
MEKSSIDILKEIAKSEHWDIQVAEKEHGRLGRRYGYSRREIIVKNPDFPNSYLIYVQNPNYNKYNLYSGVFFPVNIPENFHLLLRNRNPLDKLSFRKNILRFKIGSSKFDSKINIVTNNDIETHKLLSSANIQHEIMVFMKQGFNLHIGINEINPAFKHELKGHNYLSIFNSMEWMVEKELIMDAFKLGAILNEKIK